MSQTISEMRKTVQTIKAYRHRTPVYKSCPTCHHDELKSVKVTLDSDKNGNPVWCYTAKIKRRFKSYLSTVTACAKCSANLVQHIRHEVLTVKRQRRAYGEHAPQIFGV
jgi:hypothetical protein